MSTSQPKLSKVAQAIRRSEASAASSLRMVALNRFQRKLADRSILNPRVPQRRTRSWATHKLVKVGPWEKSE